MVPAFFSVESLVGRLRKESYCSIPTSTNLFDQFQPPLSVRLLVLQPTPFCNINCDYCYLPHRDNKSRMSLEVVESAVKNVVTSRLLGGDLSIVWHAGEPLVVPPVFYRSSFERIRELIPSEVSIRHSIQTNGVLISDEWCRLFIDFDVCVGVSLDGPVFIHDTHRKMRSGKGSHALLMDGINRLKKNRVPFHAIAVITGDSLSYPNEIFDFFMNIGVTEVGFNIDEVEGTNSKSTLEGKEIIFETFLKEIFNRAIASGGRLRVRELERAKLAILRGIGNYRLRDKEYPDNAQVIPFAITSVDYQGNFSMFSPELLGQWAPKYDNFVLGNVLRDPLPASVSSYVFQRLYQDIGTGIKECARTCQYFSLCGGGAPANKYYELGSMAVTETAYCRKIIKIPIDLVLDKLERKMIPKVLG